MRRPQRRRNLHLARAEIQKRGNLWSFICTKAATENIDHLFVLCTGLRWKYLKGGKQITFSFKKIHRQYNREGAVAGGTGRRRQRGRGTRHLLPGPPISPRPPPTQPRAPRLSPCRLPLEMRNNFPGGKGGRLRRGSRPRLGGPVGAPGRSGRLPSPPQLFDSCSRILHDIKGFK